MLEGQTEPARKQTETPMLQLLSPNGILTGEADITAERLLGAYKNMLLTRIIDDKMIALQRQGRMGTYVSCAGQEASQVGAVLALRETDWVFPMYRDLGIVIQRGVPLDSLMNRLFGNKDDESLGRDLPNAFGWRKYRLFTLAAPIASHVPLAVGFAMAARYRKDDAITLSTFGDGATSSGEFHVAMNFAGVYNAQTVFVCENNQYAISVPVSKQTASKTIAEKASAYGFEGIRVDGNDIFAVHRGVSQATERARKNGGPTLIECVTYRIGAHSTSDDWKKYRTNDEVEQWRKKDPLSRLKIYLTKTGMWSEDADSKLAKDYERLVSEASLRAEKIAPPGVESMFTDVYASVPESLKDEVLGQD